MYGDGQNYGVPGWGNNELQRYTDSAENIYLNAGCLFIIPTYNTSSDGTGYESARINSQNKRKFKCSILLFWILYTGFFFKKRHSDY